MPKTFPSNPRAGFTLAEMLTVIAIIAILATMTGMALLKARELARRTRSETELRALTEAFQQYYNLYEKWPSAANTGGGFQDVSRDLIDPLTEVDHAENPRGILFLDISLPEGVHFFHDPWGRPYQLNFGGDSDDIPVEHAFKITVDFANRNRKLL